MVTLPSTMGLKAFEAAARLMNFTRAAKELGLTQGAISHQIRELEGILGKRLFERRSRGIALTKEGQVYLDYAREALEQLKAGAASLKRHNNVLTVSAPSSFTRKWLMPRLDELSTTLPDLDLWISAKRQRDSLLADGVDVAIRQGDGKWPRLDCKKFCSESIFPVCSPALLTPGALLERLGDLRRHVLLHDRDRTTWREWLATHGVATDPADHGPVLDNVGLAIDAAIAGQGVALAHGVLASHDLEGSRLVRPLREAVPASFGYWTVCPPKVANETKIIRFREWLSLQASKSADYT